MDDSFYLAVWSRRDGDVLADWHGGRGSKSRTPYRVERHFSGIDGRL